MVKIDTYAYILEMILDVFIFMVIFIKAEHLLNSKKLVFLMIISIPISLFVSASVDIDPIYLYSILLFLIAFSDKRKNNLNLLNSFLFAELDLLVSSLITSAIIENIFNLRQEGVGLVSLQEFVKLLIALFIYYVFIKIIKFKQLTDESKRLLIMIQTSVILILIFYIKVTKMINIFDRFTIGTIAFLGFQLILMIFLFNFFVNRSKR